MLSYCDAEFSICFEHSVAYWWPVVGAILNKF